MYLFLKSRATEMTKIEVFDLLVYSPAARAERDQNQESGSSLGSLTWVAGIQVFELPCAAALEAGWEAEAGLNSRHSNTGCR